ncbi:hypothetical protein LINGRAHAP2_LOCUS2646, partial [Linum grandiflorum]
MASSQKPNKKAKTGLFNYFKSKSVEATIADNQKTPETEGQSASEPVPHEIFTASSIENPSLSTDIEVERDPAKRIKICDWPIALRDEVRRKYLLHKAYQPKLLYYKPRQVGNKMRRFQEAWYGEFHWLEYSPTTHKAYCFPCFLFRDKIHEKQASALVEDGFSNW